MLLVLTGCKSSGGATSNNTTSHNSAGSIHVRSNTESSVSDMDIASAIYSDQRTPEDFYSLDVPEDAYYTVVNLKSTDLLSAADRSGEPVYELGTNDFTQALQWSETAAGHRPVYKQLVNNTETEWYFEFTRVDLTNPQFVELHRIFKLNAIDRTAIDLNNMNSYQGTLALNMLSESNVKMIDEYFWTFSFKNNYGNAVLSSEIEDATNEYTHSMTQAQLTPGINGECDVIEVVTTTYSVEKSTGDIFMSETPIKNIYAKQVTDGVKICQA